MRLEELYPYWGYAHQQLLDTLDYLTEAQLEYRPFPAADSIAEIMVRLIRDERRFVGVLIADYEEYRPAEKEHSTTGALIEALCVTREITRRVLEPFSQEGLRAVRTVPADPARNQPETNVPVSRLVWQVMENELTAWGRISQRLDDARLLKPIRDLRRN